MKGRSCTHPRSKPSAQEQHRDRTRIRFLSFRPAARLRAGDLRRLRGYLEGSDDAPYAAHVGDKCDSRRRAGRRDLHRRGHLQRLADLTALHRAGAGSSDAGNHQCGRRLRGHRTHAADVQEERTGEKMTAYAEAQTIVFYAATLAAVVLFIMGLRYLSSPATARVGNRYAAAGMLVAIAASIWRIDAAGWWVILAGVVIGTAIGLFSALKVKMTAMPQMVALFNGAGGGAAACISTAEFFVLA